MITPTHLQAPLTDLLTELEAAVRAGDRARATELERAILQRLATEVADQAALERRVRALMAELDQLEASPGLESFDPLDLEKSSSSAEVGDVVYPVWFGTNRKPNARGDGFTGERHDCVSLGRVEVFVPEAHRFGEIGSSFMTRLWRFDPRDDRLRVQQVETREREAFFAEIQQAMQAARDGGDQPHALVFLHGFNVSFEEAAIRGADWLRPGGDGGDGVL